MKTYLQFLAFCTFFSAFSQNPSDLDQDFNVVPIPENRYCLDRKVTTVGTTSTGNMLIYDHLEGLSYIDAEQNLIRHFNFFGSGPSFILQGDDKAIVVLNGSPTWNGVPVPNIFRINLSSGLIDSSFNLDPNITVNNVASSQIHIWNNKLYVKAGSVLVNGVFKTI
nr:hypothetical protein [Flavobacterium sp.]